MIIALTGGLACGKSTVGDWLAGEGWTVLDTDHVAHACMANNAGLKQALVEEFGNGILGDDAAIDRGILGPMVFSDEAKLKRLNALVHPVVREEVKRWIAERGPDEKGCVIVPLLFETGWDEGDWQAIVCVTAPAEACRERLLERGIEQEEADRRIAAQWPMEMKAGRSDYVIVNDQDLNNLYVQLKQLTHALHGME